MDVEENLNEDSSVGNGGSGSEAENSRDKNLERSDSLDDESKLEEKKSCQTEDCVNPLQETELQVGVELTETVVISEEVRGPLHDKNGSPNAGLEIERRGTKRARITVGEHQPEHQPSVHLVYSSLTRASKQKLEELLQQWSEWHAKHVSPSNDPSEVLESGEETFFPALCVGHEKTSAMAFWMENQTRNDKHKDAIPLDHNSVPLYDRGYVLGLTSSDGLSNPEGGLEIIAAPARCFNCGSYSHSLRECLRPRDNVAVNAARKQLKSKRNQNASSRNPTRYYQNSPAGKYDGLRPGTLDDATRQLLGLGVLDPPPWLNRMRDMGYPPGYLDVDDEDQPSGITIFTDKDMAEQEDGEIMGTDCSKEKWKMSVEFPGINAPIPENADERLWSARSGPSSSSDVSRNWSQQKQRSSNYGSRGHHREQRTGDLRDDDPPGDPGYSSSKYSFHPRFGGHVSPNLMAELSRSPLHEEGSPKPASFHSLHYSTPDRFLSPLGRDSGGRHRNWTSESPHDRDRDRDHSSHFNDRWSGDRHYRSSR